MKLEPVVSPNLPEWIKDHLTRYIESDGEDGYWWDPAVSIGRPDLNKVPILLLTTVGRKSGKITTVPLIFGKSGESYVVLGTKGGSPTHPAWYLNLLANPEVGLQVKAVRCLARARRAEGKEREALWKMMTGFWPLYEKQVEATDREIPVVVLDPVRRS